MTAAPIRWGILGTGWIADQMVTDLIGSGLTVQAVGSRSQEAADAFADKYGIEHRYSSYEALVNADDIELGDLTDPAQVESAYPCAYCRKPTAPEEQAIAIRGGVGAGDAVLAGEEANCQHTPDAGEAVDRDSAHWVDDFRPVEQADAHDDDERADHADNDGRPRVDHGTGSRDADESAKDAVHGQAKVVDAGAHLRPEDREDTASAVREGRRDRNFGGE